jgi:hypothetical protein
MIVVPRGERVRGLACVSALMGVPAKTLTKLCLLKYAHDMTL